MSAEHTPGPWRAEKQFYDASSYYIRGSDKNGKKLTWGKGAVAHIPRSTVMPMDANAALIAAAPDLLAALVGLMNHPDGGTYRTPESRQEVKAARAAIAKATGGSV